MYTLRTLALLTALAVAPALGAPPGAGKGDQQAKRIRVDLGKGRIVTATLAYTPAARDFAALLPLR